MNKREGPSWLEMTNEGRLIQRGRRDTRRVAGFRDRKTNKQKKYNALHSKLKIEAIENILKTSKAITLNHTPKWISRVRPITMIYGKALIVVIVCVRFFLPIFSLISVFCLSINWFMVHRSEVFCFSAFLPPSSLHVQQNYWVYYTHTLHTLKTWLNIIAFVFISSSPSVQAKGKRPVCTVSVFLHFRCSS